ncbi:hypothetical protein DRE_01781 [Drechslerella stenobrocha 248]|uniref:Uracil-DNA glycosylase-like domain-containing protein n=1 Tax=Drechslerella stenobrocha 248 TaxID=1043628 RepID=W7HYI1_9PEZI|nr:hypothetical protein DRE_01781 [Drechslerella stenobrocha 248]
MASGARTLRSSSGTPATGNAIVEFATKGDEDKIAWLAAVSGSDSGSSSGSASSAPRTDTANADKTPVKRKYTDLLSYKAGASPGPKKKAARSSSYAPPSKYAHLNGVPCQLSDNMLCMFIGLNPGVATAQAGHCYANPSNLFWRLMHKGGLTTRQCRPQEDVILPKEFNLGTTNIVSRPTASQAELSQEEMDDGVAELERKCRQYRPEAVCLVGKAIWESVWRSRHGGTKITKAQFKFGWQDAKENMGVDKKNGYPGAKVYVVVSTSGLCAGYSLEYKIQLWTKLGDWVNQRRAERAAAAAEVATEEEGGPALASGTEEDPTPDPDGGVKTEGSP